MRVYWLNGALQLEPETSEEWTALGTLVRDVKFGFPPDSHPPSLGQQAGQIEVAPSDVGSSGVRGDFGD
jgi:hypothetical protein